MLVSFIIPSYNSAHTVARCLDSIYALSLNLQEFEVIFIDDCSSDNTCEIVAEYQSKYSNITLLKQPQNNRQGAARNRGVKIAKGEYICFVDSDDAVVEGIVIAIHMAKEKEADMVAFHYCNANEQGEMTSEAKWLSFEKGQIFTGIEMQNKHPYWCSAPWGFIYRKAFLHEVSYPFVEGVLYEDSDFVAVHLYHAKRMVYSSEIGYVAYYREGSTTRCTNYKNLADYLLLGTRMLQFYERIAGSQMIEDEGVEQFAEGILEGACWNVEKSCKRLIKLPNVYEVKAYYERIDGIMDRKVLSADKRIHKYYWNVWTSMCVKHKYVSLAFLSVLIPIYKLLKRL